MKSFPVTVMVWCLMIGLSGAIMGCGKAIPPLDDHHNQTTDYVPCIGSDQCQADQACDTSECLSCCPNSTGPCIDLCCGKCAEPTSDDTCATDADCTYGAEWCEDGTCVACDNSGAYCDLYCANGMVDPRHGCQPCVCKADYVPCLDNEQCEKGQVCDRSDCLYCCPGSTGACIAACCGKCVEAPAGCASDADCVHGFVCEPTSPGTCDESSKRCVAGCHQESDCDVGQTCVPLCCFTCPCPGVCQTTPSCEDKTYSRSCREDFDCTCGINVATKECDYGIAECIDASQQCPDFCTGIGGNLEIVCRDNLCTQITTPRACKTDADCSYGAEWCEKGVCVPCDNSGEICTILCVLVGPRNGCQPCKCETSDPPCTSDDQCDPGQKCDRSECLSCCSPIDSRPCIDLCCGRCVDSVVGFCGRSTDGPCVGDTDCATGGCSGQVCQSNSEDPAITTCEWTACYDAKSYGVTCGCVNKQCRWK